MEQNQSHKKEAVVENDRRGYKPPQLVVYGKLRQLTQASTSGSSEGSSGSGVMKPGSDINIKENIVRIGTHPLGIGLYLFDYKSEYRGQWGEGRQFGVMAQEVETVMPEAVDRHAEGYKVVDYALLGISRAVN